jgi:hypothetical protein
LSSIVSEVGNVIKASSKEGGKKWQKFYT